ncbi:MAG TPA: TipAS antibiotic-recognition domain-containing protein [Terriglobales bacterium]|jgi:DNA-binding transcriptional MerR regulator|nr:TipAS antibiotic-recognition domain-containing protein [Terriglobales bacterium]
MSKLYRVHEFAELAGVTVRALHHYDRLGLLEPRRTAAGYRVYTLRDLERLEQIVALKFLGLPLKQIKLLLDQDTFQLSDALHMQRTVLEEKRRLLDRAISAIEDAEKVILSGKPADAAVLKKIIEVIEMQNSTEVMKKYFSEEAWVKWQDRQVHWPSQQWIELFRGIEASLNQNPNEDPAGKKGQAFAARWIKLGLSETGGDPEIQVGLLRAWVDRQNWPPAVQQKVSEFDLEKIGEFISKATSSYKKKYYSDEAWTKLLERPQESREQASLAWCELFIEAGAALGENPAGEKAQRLATRWMELVESSSGGDPDLKAGALKAWADRQHWPAAERERIASFNVEKIADFISDALVSYRKKYYSDEAWAKMMEQRKQSAPEARVQVAQAWSDLFRDVEAALGEDPAGEKAQALVARWKELTESSTGGDPEIKAGAMKAWEDRQNWPAWHKQSMGLVNHDKIAEFIGKAFAGPIVKYFSDEAWRKWVERKQTTPESRQRSAQVQRDLFHEFEAMLGEDPAGEKAQALAARWIGFFEAESGSDPDIKAAWEKFWKDRCNWPDTLKQRIVSGLRIDSETFDKVADFMDNVLACRRTS